MASSPERAGTEGDGDQKQGSGAITVTFFTTGTVQIRPQMRSQPISNQWVLGRRLRSFFDRGWTDPLPIGVFLVSHPDGPILFDTGESPRRNEPGFVPGWLPINLLARTTISREDGVVAQLRSRGIEPSALQAVVISHLHGDHAGGLQELVAAAPDVPVYVSREHWDFVTGTNSLHAKTQGFDRSHWPANFKPRFLEPLGGPVGPWKQSAKITADGRVLAVDTPGHVPGHISVIVQGDGDGGRGTTYLLAGDATYGTDFLDREEPDGINDDPKTALKSLMLIKEFARETELVVLPSHDAAVERLLKDRVVYKPKP
ncbi:hypothetical protein MYCTH_2124653 [Thermothelomyces thermophilus ATCC 42464]|uniref:Metallo-beta-lactamase domain-containing protein n=1 Tax=Thermothelomyces thermophilus (strain ATCC 42464 / BCRC 31852 / DSM 1799) TaxID=573729 RepID=G2PZK9_THET4|nr:uncharacterized protein MYCTH_2124653 [Thermothelomyces thermophilus ATCC 42464]AEO55695.1 hypothetical protein MYCTH_2124653 [Thermothelomyces thermophilus ATCC 42464]